MASIKRKTIRSAVIIIIIVAIFIAALSIPVTSRMVIIHDGVTVLSFNAENGSKFIIRYCHSVNRSDVSDTIEITGNTLTVRSSLFSSFGAGIPVADDKAGEIITVTEEGLLLSGIDMEYPFISLYCGSFANHRIIAENQEYNLSDIFGVLERIEIKIKKISIYSYIMSNWRRNTYAKIEEK